MNFKNIELLLSLVDIFTIISRYQQNLQTYLALTEQRLNVKKNLQSTGGVEVEAKHRVNCIMIIQQEAIGVNTSLNF